MYTGFQLLCFVRAKISNICWRCLSRRQRITKSEMSIALLTRCVVVGVEFLFDRCNTTHDDRRGDNRNHQQPTVVGAPQRMPDDDYAD